MTIDITEPQDTTLMSSFHTHFQDAKSQVAERMEAQSSPGVYEHNEHDSSDFGIHPYNIQFALEHGTLADLEGYTPKVNGSLHVVLDPPSLYSIESGSLVLLDFFDHAALKNLDDSLHDDDFFRVGTSVIAEGAVTIEAGGSIVPTDQEFVEDSDPLDPVHLDLSHLDAHGTASVDNTMLEDDAYELAVTSPYFADSVSGVDLKLFSSRAEWHRDDYYLYKVDSGFYFGLKNVNIMVFQGFRLGTDTEVST